MRSNYSIYLLLKFNQYLIAFDELPYKRNFTVMIDTDENYEWHGDHYRRLIYQHTLEILSLYLIIIKDRINLLINIYKLLQALLISNQTSYIASYNTQRPIKVAN